MAVLGLGNVGREVVRIIEESAADLAARIGAPLELRGVGRAAGVRRPGVPVEMLTDNVEDLVSREDVDIVVELMGPVEPARKAILTALEHGKSVVTANKALLAQSTGELAQAAERAHVDLYFEAAVAGAIPVIRPLTQSLAGDTVLQVAGIVNGTTNHPVRDGFHRSRLRQRTGRRERWATPRPTHRRRRGLRRRGKARSWPRSPSTPRHRRRRVPRGITKVTPRTSKPPARWAARSSCWPSANA